MANIVKSNIANALNSLSGVLGTSDQIVDNETGRSIKEDLTKDYVIWKFTEERNEQEELVINTYDYKYSEIANIMQSGKTLMIRIIDNYDGFGEQRAFVYPSILGEGYMAIEESVSELFTSQGLQRTPIWFLDEGENDSILCEKNSELMPGKLLVGENSEGTEALKFNGDPLAFENQLPTKISQLTNDAGYVVGYEGKYFTIEPLENGSVQFSGGTLEYSIDNGDTWNSLAANTALNVTADQDVWFRGGCTPTGTGIGTFSATGNFNVSGNILSLTLGDSFAGVDSVSVSQNYFWRKLFNENTHIVNAHNLIFPLKALPLYALAEAFQGCTSLVTPPQIKATTVSDNSFQNAFQNCTSLTYAPELHITNVAVSCFSHMFYGCTALKDASNIIIADTAQSCCTNMFNSCTSLVGAPKIVATTTSDSCYFYMFHGCTSLTTAPELPATTLAQNCYNQMFDGCTSLTTAPELPATTLAQNCYYGMFYECTSLTTAPSLPATTLAPDCYDKMFSGCANLTTAPELPAVILDEGCYDSMFDGCTSLIKAPELPAIILAQYCYQGMFRFCTSLKKAPELPAINLDEGCYDSMFDGCTSLNYVKAMFLSVPSDSPSHFMDNWLRNVSQTGTFICSNEYMWSNVASSIIPSGWSTYLTKREYSKEYFTIHNSSLSSSYFNISSTNSSVVVTISYSKNGGQTWTNITSTTLAQSIQINSGEDVLIKGLNSSYGINNNYYTKFLFNNGRSFTISGNIMSLLYGDNFLDKKELFVPYTFAYLFAGSTITMDASNLILPATTLAPSCYWGMFSGCPALTTAPELPATTLANYCYGSMFNSCSSLTTPPQLPSTTLAPNCYQSMFHGCTSLTTAPNLPATTLAKGCYYGMFQGCTSLTTAPNLPATTLANSCYQQMFLGCTSLTTAPSLPATTLANYCYHGMFQGCTNLTTAPELPATTLAQNCYINMFYRCTSLNYIKALFTTAPSNTYTQDWVNGVASTGTFIKNSSASWNVIGTYGIPSDWTVHTTPKDKVVRQYQLDYQLDELTNDIDSKLAPAQITTSLTPTKTKFLNKTIYNLCIPIDTTKNIYSGDSISNSSVIPFIGGVQKYLKFSKGNVLPTNYDILSAKLYGSGISDGLSTITDSNGVVSLYSLVPIEQYLSNLQYVILESIDTASTISGMWINNYGYESNIGLPNINKNAISRLQGFSTWEAFVDDMLHKGPTYYDADEYNYTNETLLWEGETYYLWSSEAGYYILTSTIDYNTLYNMSIAADYSNEICPFVAFLSYDESDDTFYEYDTNRSNYWLVDVDGAGGNATTLFIDKFVISDADKNGWTTDLFGYDWDEFVLNGIDDVNSSLYDGAKHFIYDGETFEWNGETYYLLTSANDTHDDSEHAQYLLADSVDYNYLYSMSLEADYNNGYCPYVAILDEDMQNYGHADHFQYSLIKVEQ